MDRRLTILETRFDTLLPTLATKADLEILRAEIRIGMEKLQTEFQYGLREEIRWMFNLVLTLFLGILEVNIAMWSSLKSSVDSLQYMVVGNQRNAVQPPPAPRPPAPVPYARGNLNSGNETPSPNRRAHNSGEEAATMDTAVRFPTSPKAVKAAPVELSRRMSAEQAFQVIMQNCIDHIQSNAPGVVRGHDVECLHQMRVGLRRMRAALGMYKDVVRLPQDIQQELDWLLSVLGPARDWDVLLEFTLPRIAGALADAAALSVLTAAVREKTLKMQEHAGTASASIRYQKLLHELENWVGKRAWRDSLQPKPAKRLKARVPDFADAILKADQRRLLRRGRKLKTAVPEARHRVRIAAKKTRYAAEFFASLYPGKRVRPYVKALASLQDELGWLNDVAVADGLLDELAQENVELQPQVAVARGYLASQVLAADQGLRKAWKIFKPLDLPR